MPGQQHVDRAKVVLATVLAARGTTIRTETGDSLAKRVVLPVGGTTARFVGDTEVVPLTDRGKGRVTVLVAGRHSAASLREAIQRQPALRGAQVLYVPPTGEDSTRQQPVLAELRALSHGVVVISAADSATFAARAGGTAPAAARRCFPTGRGGGPPGWWRSRRALARQC